MRSDFLSAKITTKAVDVRDAQAIDAAVTETADELGNVNMLLCFAGVVDTKHATEMGVEDWKRILDINTTGSWLCAQAVGKYVAPLHDYAFLYQCILSIARSIADK